MKALLLDLVVFSAWFGTWELLVHHTSITQYWWACALISVFGVGGTVYLTLHNAGSTTLAVTTPIPIVRRVVTRGNGV